MSRDCSSGRRLGLSPDLDGVDARWLRCGATGRWVWGERMSAERTLAKTVRLSALLCSFGVACGLAVNFAAAQTGLFNGTYAGTQTLTTDPDDHNYAQCLK